ncbi:response regulator [Mesoterricola silvestris]|uniref:Two-component system response regulator n=1 Tax=Mesoterricola silvestris TaxID=2927979 RepID=A0AA48KB23_9BACT|nr:response regulator [Mesoterricola silvestris]BDU73897.1 two-component system response regulator [Mesoterricola silvestris]
MAAKTRILFVDDEPLVLQGLQRLLRSMRGEWDMVFVTSGAEGLEELARAPFDVVVADMRMPGMNGAEFLNRVMRLYPGTIRLVLSGQADSDLILQVEGAAHQFLSKPCDPGILRTVIQSASEIGGRLRSDEIRRVLGGISHLPVLPAAYQEIQALLAIEATTVEDLGRVVEKDPGMTGNILKLVNSAYFGLRQRVSDPAEAVAFLGFDTLKALALVHGIFQQVRDFPPGFNGGHLWRHSLELAAGARGIARHEGLGREQAADCFTGGLLHDIGLLLMASGFPAEYQRISGLLASGGVELLDAEMDVLGVHHGEVGAHLLGLWGLPGAVVEAVAHHHGPRPALGITPEVIVHAAEVLSTSVGDFQVFGLHRDVDDAPIEDLLGPRLPAWKGILDRLREA